MKITLKLPNLSLSRGQIAELEEPPRAIARRRRLRAALRWLGLGTAVLVIAGWMSLPTEALAWRISHEAAKHGYRVTIGDISVWPWGSVKLHDVKLFFTPARAQQPPPTYFLPKVSIDIGLLALLRGRIDVEIDTERDEGGFWGRYKAGQESSAFSVLIDNVPLADLPRIPQDLQAPLQGYFRLQAELEIPRDEAKNRDRFSQANGHVELACAGCRVGDGETKLYIPNSQSLSSGVTMPEIDLGTITGKLEVKEGVATFTEPMETESPDLKMHLSGDVRLRDNVGTSNLKLVFRVELSEALQARSEQLRFLVQTADPRTILEAPEKGLGYRIEGPIGSHKLYGYKKSERQQQTEQARRKRRERAAEAARARAAREAAASDNAPPDDDPTIPSRARTQPDEPPDGPSEDNAPPIITEPMEDAPPFESGGAAAPADEG